MKRRTMVGIEWGCAGKKRFNSYWAADRSAKTLNRYRHDAKAHVYKCEHCRSWHVGNNTKKRHDEK